MCVPFWRHTHTLEDSRNHVGYGRWKVVHSWRLFAHLSAVSVCPFNHPTIIFSSACCLVADLLTIIITHILLLRLTLADYNELLLLYILWSSTWVSAPRRHTLCHRVVGCGWCVWTPGTRHHQPADPQSTDWTWDLILPKRESWRTRMHFVCFLGALSLSILKLNLSFYPLLISEGSDDDVLLLRGHRRRFILL